MKTIIRLAILGCAVIGGILPVADAFAQRVSVSANRRATSQDRQDAYRTGGPDEAKLIAGLRQRQLFDLAESHCRRLLADEKLSPVDQAIYLIELMKTQTAWAMAGDAADRESGWADANHTAVEFLKQNPAHPRSVLIQLQQALAHVAFGDVLRQELEAEMVPAGQRQLARENAFKQLRTANMQFNDIHRRVEQMIPDHRARTLNPAELTPEELMTLQHRVTYQLALVNLNRARLYPTDDRLNRIDALHRVNEQIEQVQRKTTVGQPLWWDTQILQIECWRLLGEINRAAALADQLAKISANDPIQDRLTEEQLRLARAMDDQKKAVELIRRVEVNRGRDGFQIRPTLALAVLETQVWLAAVADGPEQQQWLERATRFSGRIERDHGRYWGRRAKLVLIGSGKADQMFGQPIESGGADPATDSAKLSLLIELAQQAVTERRFEDAVKAYDRSVELAKRTNDLDQAFGLGVRAAHVVEQQGQQLAAAQRFLDLAVNNHRNRLSSTVHVRGCWNLARGLSDGSVSQADFVKALEEHLELWPQAESADQVRLWLGGQHQKAGNWQAAFESYASVSPASTHFDQSLPRAEYCAKKWLESIAASDQKLTLIRIAKWWNDWLEAAPRESVAHSKLLLAFTEFGIRHGTLERQSLAERLESAIETASDPRLKQELGAWLLAVLVFDATRQDEFLDKLSEIRDQESCLEIAETAIVLLTDQIRDHDSQSVQQKRLRLIESALELDLDKSKSNVWKIRKADALGKLGQTEQALTALLELEQTFPRDAGIQLSIARFMSAMQNESDRDEALVRWRRLAAGLKPRSEPWFEAKLQIATLLQRAGEKESARKMLEYLKAVPPGWTASQWSDELESLLQRLK